MQVPSKVSAIKIDGKRSYTARARGRGRSRSRPAPVTVSSFTVHDVREAVAEDGTRVLDLVVSVVCSSGTYIRALARDLGAELGVGGHLTALRRTRVGPYGLDGRADARPAPGGADRCMPIARGRRRRLPPLGRGRGAGARCSATACGWRCRRGVHRRGRRRRRCAVFGPDGRFLALVEEQKGKAKSLAVFV